MKTKQTVTSEAEEQVNTTSTEQPTLADLSLQLSNPELSVEERTQLGLEIVKMARESICKTPEQKEEMRLHEKAKREAREEIKKKKDAILKGVRQAEHRVTIIVKEVVLTTEGKTEETIIAETTRPLLNAKGNFVKNTVVFDRMPSQEEMDNGEAEKDKDGFWKVIKEHSVCDKRVWNEITEHNTNKGLDVMFDAQIRMCAKGQANLRKMPTVLAESIAKPEQLEDGYVTTASKRGDVDAQRQELLNKAKA